MGFPRELYWSGLSFPSPGDLSNPEIEPKSPALAVGSFITEPPHAAGQLRDCTATAEPVALEPTRHNERTCLLPTDPAEILWAATKTPRSQIMNIKTHTFLSQTVLGQPQAHPLT